MFKAAPAFSSGSYTLVGHRMREPFRRTLSDAGIPTDIINDHKALQAFVCEHFTKDSSETAAMMGLQQLVQRLPDLTTYKLMRLGMGLEGRRKTKNGGKRAAANAMSGKNKRRGRILADYKTSLASNSGLKPARWAKLHDMEYDAIDGSGRKLKASSLRALLAKALADEKALSA